MIWMSLGENFIMRMYMYMRCKWKGRGWSGLQKSSVGPEKIFMTSNKQLKIPHSNTMIWISSHSLRNELSHARGDVEYRCALECTETQSGKDQTSIGRNFHPFEANWWIVARVFEAQQHEGIGTSTQYPLTCSTCYLFNPWTCSDFDLGTSQHYNMWLESWISLSPLP
jgi:hypothetical protein